MKALIILIFTGLISACMFSSSKFSEVSKQVSLSSDPKVKLQLLQKNLNKICAESYVYCQRFNEKIAALEFQLENYPAAIKAAEKAKNFNEKYSSSRSTQPNDPFYLNLKCSGSGGSKPNISIYYQSLKLNQDTRAKDYMDWAYFCELNRMLKFSSDKEEIIQILSNYQKDAYHLKNTTEQKDFIQFYQKILMPLSQANIKIKKDYDVQKLANDPAIQSQLYQLYKNALIQAEKNNIKSSYRTFLVALVAAQKSSTEYAIKYKNQ